MPTAAISIICDEIDREDLPAGRAEALQRRDRGALAVDEAAHRIGDADAADDQRRQADQGQELREPLDVAGKRGSALTRERISQPASGRPCCASAASASSAASSDASRGQREPVGPAHQAAGLQQAGRAQGRPARPGSAARSRCRSRSCPARRRGWRGARRSRRRADPVADLEVEPRAAAPGRRRRRTRRSRWREDRPAGSAGSVTRSPTVGIGGVDRLELDQAGALSPASAMARMVAIATPGPAPQEGALRRRRPRAGSARRSRRRRGSCGPARRARR